VKNYLAVIDQENPGCDYTIACGITVLYAEAENYEAAFKDFVNQLGWQDYVDNLEAYTENPLRGEQEVMAFDIFELTSTDEGEYYIEFMDTMDVDTDAAKAAEAQAKDEAEFARLQRKLGR
jgi:hypothetical protein